MAGEREITVERSLLSRIFNYRTLTVTGACSLVAASLLLKWKKTLGMGEKVHPWQRIVWTM